MAIFTIQFQNARPDYYVQEGRRILVGEIGYLFNLIFTYPIFNGLVLLYHLFGDFALSIIVLTLIIKLVLFPLTLKQLKSMKATQALQPQVQEINKKYAKDAQAKGLAMQALYKEYGVNPLAGCLPMLVQFPVLYGLFFALNTVLRIDPKLTDAAKLIDINNILYPFVGHFQHFTDLNTNLSWFTFINHSWAIPLGSPDPTHILPILAAVLTFVQLRMSQAKVAPGATPDPSTQSMKMMQFLMPVVVLFFGWTYPAGLALYWATSTTFQAVQQYFVTGWGSLMIMPDFNIMSAPATTGKSNSATATRSYTSETAQRRKERRQVERDDMSDGVVESTLESDGNDSSISDQLRTTPRPNGSSYNRRRQRSSSASARRRGGSAQRSRG